jgi:hypothetical protein
LRQIPHPILRTSKHFTPTNTLPIHLLQRNPLRPYRLRLDSASPMARQPLLNLNIPRQSNRRHTLSDPPRPIHSSNPKRQNPLYQHFRRVECVQRLWGCELVVVFVD